MQWNWNTLGAEVEAARRACVSSGRPGHAEAAARFHRAVDAAWPPGFFEQLDRVKRGEQAGLDDVLDFVEACPYFFRTGYVLSRAVRYLPRPPRNDTQAERLRAIVLAAVERRLRVPFDRIPSLARAVCAPGLRARLRALADDPREAVRDRAARTLDALPGPPWSDERARMRGEEERLGSMLATLSKSGGSATLARRILDADPATLSSRGRRLLAVAFEHAMNKALLPDGALLEIARSLDGPELEDVWLFAVERPDEPGDRARWLMKRLRDPLVRSRTR